MKCLLCGAATKSKPQLIQHLCQHLAYKKYPCTTCTELFYTEEEREIHCRKKAHVHTYEVKSSPYCELYLNQLLKDFEHVELYGLEAVILQRSKSNLTCDVAINKKTPRVVTNRKGDVTTTPDHELTSTPKQRPLPRSNSASDTVALRKEEASPSCSYKKTTKDNAQSSANREQKLTDDWTRFEVDKTPDLSTATQLLADTLRTKISEHCRLCHKSTSSDYVERKHHVSSAHLPKDHTESDYVEILSEMDSHNLVRGYLSIVDEQQKRQFVEQKHLFNQRLANVIDRAFPCPIPECAKPGFKNSDAPNSVQEMITKFGDSSRKFQRAPPNPLRLRSPSSDSDSDSTTQYKKKQPASDTKRTAQSSLLSENEGAIKRKKVDSESSDISSTSTTFGSSNNRRSPLSSIASDDNVEKVTAQKKEAKLKQVSDLSSVSSSLKSTEADDVTKVVSPPAPEEVVLDDDEGEDKHVPEVSPKNSPQKQPQVRKLAISGVCIKAPRMRASPERSVKSEPPKGGRRLAISGVVVPVDRTPLSAFERPVKIKTPEEPSSASHDRVGYKSRKKDNLWTPENYFPPRSPSTYTNSAEPSYTVQRAFFLIILSSGRRRIESLHRKQLAKAVEAKESTCVGRTTCLDVRDEIVECGGGRKVRRATKKDSILLSHGFLKTPERLTISAADTSKWEMDFSTIPDGATKTVIVARGATDTSTFGRTNLARDNQAFHPSEMHFTVVESNEQLYELTSKWYFLTADQNVNVVHQDGAHYLKDSVEQGLHYSCARMNIRTFEFE
ncbi:unnamed protein product [Nippostrongylus brasiliensis]|uniref:C2H2-type domain-containing protein n=1 Tax=Nippostrongylus brasiliensis TaxID=27835 RepID=A0A158QZK4_NIPBR|nr:unnamed protein product [Nippostrongylus brasiliensis]